MRGHRRHEVGRTPKSAADSNGFSSSAVAFKARRRYQAASYSTLQHWWRGELVLSGSYSYGVFYPYFLVFLLCASSTVGSSINSTSILFVFVVT